MSTRKPVAEHLAGVVAACAALAVCIGSTSAAATQAGFESGSPAERVEALSDAYLANPRDHKLRVALGLALVDDGQYARAERLLGAAYRKEQSDSIAIGLAQARYALGQYQAVLNLLRAPGATEADERIKRSLRFEALIRLRRFDEIIAISSSEKNAADPASAFALARARYGLGDVSAAVDLMDDVLRAGYALSEAWLFRARIALQQNETDFARKALRRAEEAGLLQSGAAPFMIEADIRDGLFDKAQKAIRSQQDQKSSADRKDARLVYAAGFLAAARGDFAQAARQFDAVAPWLAGEPRGLLLMAEAKIQSGALAQGEALLSRHLNTAPDDWIALDMAAALSLSRQSYDAALAFAEEYKNSASPNVAGLASFRHYQIYLAQKNFDLAHNELKEQARVLRGSFAFQSPQNVLFGVAGGQGVVPNPEAAQYGAGLENMRAYYAVAENASPESGHKANPVTLAINSNKLIAAGRYDEAGVVLDRAIDLAPNFSEARRLRWLIEIRKGNFQAVELQLSEANRDEQLSDWDRLKLANLRLNAGDITAVQALLDTLDDEGVFNPVIASAKARALLDANDTRGYKKLARKIASRGDDPARLIVAAKMLEAENENGAAIKIAKRALSSAPDDLETLDYFVKLMARNDRLQEARSFLGVIVRRREDALNARYSLARIAVTMDDHESVDAQLLALKETLTPLGEMTEAYRLIARGDKEAALAAGSLLAEMNYTNPMLAVEAGKIAVKAGATKAAEAILLRAHDSAPSNHELAQEIAKFYLDNQKQGALGFVEKAYRLSDAAPETAVLYALVLWREGEPAAALALSREAVWAGLPVEKYSLDLARALMANDEVDLAGAILRQIRATWLSADERESADKLLGSLTRIQVQPDEFKRLRG